MDGDALKRHNIMRSLKPKQDFQPKIKNERMTAEEIFGRNLWPKQEPKNDPLSEESLNDMKNRGLGEEEALNYLRTLNLGVPNGDLQAIVEAAYLK